MPCRVPTIARIGPYRISYLADERHEPPHVHVERVRAHAKFWLGTAELVCSVGFAAHEVVRIKELVIDHQLEFLDEWHAFFDD